MIKMKFSLHYILNDFRLSSSWKGHFSGEHYVKNNTHRPNVNFLIIMLKKNFGCNVIRGTTHCYHVSEPTEILRQSKINHFNACQVILLVKHEVFWFDISVRNLSLMQILECRKYLFHNICSNFFREVLFVNYKLEKFSSIAIFKD